MSRRPTKSNDAKWYVIALYICLAPLIVVVGLVIACGSVFLLPFIIFNMIRAERKRRETVRRFLRGLGPQVLLVWHSRRGWNEFCERNLLPALPEGVIAVQDQRRRDSAYKDRRAAEKAHSVPSQARPYLLFSDGAKLRAFSLNQVLQPFKSQGKPDTAIQHKVRQVILDQIAALPVRRLVESSAESSPNRAISD